MKPLAPGMKYGLIAAAGMTAWLLAAYALGLHSRHIGYGHYADWGTEAILGLALWRMLHHQLYTANRYWLPVWVGTLQGLYASIIAAMSFYIVFSLYLRFVNPDYPDLYLEWRVAAMRAASTPEPVIRDMARTFRWSMGPIGLPISVVGFYLILGLFLSPLITLWLNWRRKEPGEIR